MARKGNAEDQRAEKNVRSNANPSMRRRNLRRDDGRYLIYYDFGPTNEKRGKDAQLKERD